jgi:dihydroneopterin aldolase
LKLAEKEETTPRPPIVGRTFWDIAVGGTYVGGGILTILILAIFIYFWLDEIPAWFFISIGSSIFFIPFLMDRAKEDAELFMVIDEPFRLTEYRIGRKYGMDIAGQGVLFSSKSGAYRTLLTDIDLDNRIGYGSAFAEMTQFDQIRDMNTLEHLTELLQDNLRESRENTQTLGVAVEREAKVIVDWALKVIQGAMIPTEVGELFGVETAPVDDKTAEDELMEEEYFEPE